jgi:hypothetical protein
VTNPARPARPRKPQKHATDWRLLALLMAFGAAIRWWVSVAEHTDDIGTAVAWSLIAVWLGWCAFSERAR